MFSPVTQKLYFFYNDRAILLFMIFLFQDVGWLPMYILSPHVCTHTELPF